MQALDNAADRIVQPEPALLAQLQDPGRREALGVRSGTEAVARRHRNFSREIRVAEGLFEHQPIAMHDRDHAARLP
jgi:hypothetical protein